MVASVILNVFKYDTYDNIIRANLTAQCRFRMTNSIDERVQMAKRGRPPKGDYPEKKRVFASRIREDTWAKLQLAAARSGRSVSQEFEHQIRRGLDEAETIKTTWGDEKTYAMLKLAAEAVNALCRVRDEKTHWTASAELFDASLQAIVQTLKGFRPHSLTANNLEVGAPTFGATVLEIVREAQAVDPARPLNKSTKRQRALMRLKEELGEELVARAARVDEDEK